MDDIEVPDWIYEIPPGIPMDLLKLYYTIHVLRFYGGNRTHASKALCMSVRTMRHHLAYLRSIGIAVPPAPLRQKKDAAVLRH